MNTNLILTLGLLSFNLVGCGTETTNNYTTPSDDAATTTVPHGTTGSDNTDTATDDTGNTSDPGTDDCDGGDALVYWDADKDGYGTEPSAVCPSTATEGNTQWVSKDGDCNDGDASIHPGATESANGIDSNCDGTSTDSSGTVTSTFYLDGDGDGYGLSTSTTTNTTGIAPAGYVANSTDCNDANSAIHPGAADNTDDNVDNDCDGSVDEDYTASSTSLNREVCVTKSTSAWSLAYMDSGEATHTHWVTEVSSTATVVSPIMSGAAGTTGCTTVTLTGTGATVKFNGYGSDSELWGHYLVGSTGSGTYAQSSGSKSAEIVVMVDSVVNGVSDTSAMNATFSGDDLVCMP